MTKYPDLFKALAAPFEQGQVKVRVQGGKDLHYITARAVMNRLDDVLGPENWWDAYIPGEHSVLCGITIRLPDQTTLTKYDAGGYAGMADSGDDDKSGFSDSFKRAAVKLGVARYLYRDGVPSFARTEATAPRESEPTRNGNGKAHGRWGPDPQSKAAHSRERETTAVANRPPKTGRQLFAWVKEYEAKYECGLLKYMNGWAKLQGLPGRMVDWNDYEVGLAYAEAVRKLKQVGYREDE
jgi:hypothetical protein